jgi:hypothetical protein
LPRAPCRHAASYAEGPRLVEGREHDAAADRNRLAAQARVEQLFDRRIKGVEVRVRVRDSVADFGPADFKEMPSGRRGRGLTVDQQHLKLRQRIGTTAWHHCHDLITRAPLRSCALA